MTEALKKRLPWLRGLIVFSIFIILVINTTVYFKTSDAYESAVKDASANGSRLLRVMEQQIALAFWGADGALRRTSEREYYNALSGRNPVNDIRRSMQTWIDESPYITGMILVDERGRVAAPIFRKNYTKLDDYRSHSFASENIFKHLREAGESDYFIGKLSSAGSDPKAPILMGRKITRIDGTFAGIVVVAMDPDFFVSYFRSLKEGTHSHLFLCQMDTGMPLVISATHYAQYAGIKSRVYAALRKTSSNEIYIGTDENSVGNDYVLAYQKMQSLPLAILVVLDEDDYLASWRRTLVNDLEFLGMFLIYGSAITYFALAMAQKMRKIQKLEADAVLASQVKTEFLASMSHELRTPLNAIIGFSEMITSGYFGTLNDKQVERINDIRLCGGHLLHLISDILEFSKGDEGKLMLFEEQVFIKDVVDEAMRIMQARIRGKQIIATVEIEQKLPPISGDKLKIRQILLNLLSNALKFTPEGGSISLSVRLDGERRQIVTVSDTGIGIAEDDIPRALSVFGQIHGYMSHEGTGLGLPLCKMFTELHGGTLALSSVLEKGTTVQISFPALRNSFREEPEMPFSGAIMARS